MPGLEPWGTVSGVQGVSGGLLVLETEKRLMVESRRDRQHQPTVAVVSYEFG
jgi:hypothetical protein